MNLVVYTTVIGRTDPLREPKLKYFDPDVRYVCFTDNPVIASDVWEIQRLQDPTIAYDFKFIQDEPHPTRKSRLLKLRPHALFPDADATLWVDAAYEITCCPMAVALRWLWRADVLAMRHPCRDNIDQEGAEIIKLGLVPAQLIREQIVALRAMGFSKQRHITSTGYCLRRNAPRVNIFNDIWAKLFKAAGHTRDQMSVDAAIWRSHVDLHYLDGHYRDNPYARWYKTRLPKDAFVPCELCQPCQPAQAGFGACEGDSAATGARHV